MNEVVLPGCSASMVSSIISELKTHGMMVGQDFNFWYVPAVHDNFSMDQEKYARFEFASESIASWFALKFN